MAEPPPKARLSDVPRPALVLGFAGLIPFVAGSVGVWLFDGPAAIIAVHLQLAWGALVLSFVGAVHWGLALAEAAADNWRRLAPAAVPAFLGWVSLMIQSPFGLILLAGSFAGTFLADRAAVTANRAPAWYAALRKPLTLLVLLSLAASYAALAVKSS